MQSHHFIPPVHRRLLKISLVLLLFLLLSAAATIPFVWESQTLWYKFGSDKIMLRLGKIAGLFAVSLLFLQILLAVRLPLLERIFGLDRLYYFHRYNGLFIAALAMAHATLVLVPEGITNIPLGWKFWPEMLGATLLCLLVITVLAARFRHKFLPYHRWRRLHRPVGYILLLGLTVHISFVSESFEQGVPKWSLLTLLALTLTTVAISKYHSRRQTRQAWRVKEMSSLNTEVISLILTPSIPFVHAPGQFAFLSFSGKDIPSEPHPFTIASSPASADVQFMIKRCGDWTSQLETIGNGTVSVQGAFGQFSYQAQAATEQMVFIAAGIGITPMLSMLRHIGAQILHPRITLIWCLRRKSENFLEDELETLQKSIPSLQVVLIYSREGNNDRLSRQRLRDLLQSYPTTSHIYLCGPQAMMVESRASLLHLGFKKGNIFWERFSL